MAGLSTSVLSSWYALGALLKLAMLVHAARRGVAQYWYWVILFVPLGEIAYLALVSVPDALDSWRAQQRRRPPSVAALRYRYRENPCALNEALLAEGLLAAGERAEAESLFESVLRADPAYLKGVYGLACCQLELGKAAQAAEGFARVVQRERSYQDYAAYRKQAEALEQAGDPAGAIRVLEALCQADARLDHVVRLAAALKAVGQTDDAKRRLEQAMEDYRHAPRHVRRSSGEPARRATKLLGELA